ncbi:galactose-3-O-sulfotransferase 2-like [Ruditapes philippinarum]|uniref:galactose-3-O-sulfotransferase 2-like n=1 Tax=Ruditapes philippinarum TaxID=129788 RepID=UPI00295A71C0|nr:galactose-3-O-sulfotransferase 2-like [Ruditapes philippinarum]
MAEKRIWTFLSTNDIYNVFVSFVVAASLLVLAITMSRALPSRQFYKLSMNRNRLNLTPELSYICNITAGGKLSGSIDCKENHNSAGAPVKPTTQSTTTTGDVIDDYEMRRFHEEFKKAAKRDMDFGTGFNRLSYSSTSNDTKTKGLINSEHGNEHTMQSKSGPQKEGTISLNKMKSLNKDSVSELQHKNFHSYAQDSLKREALAQNVRNENKNIGPKLKHFAFLKVHKAGSTTMQNIFFRFGLKNGLTFVLPKHGHYLKYARDVIPVKKGAHYDILSNHIASFKNHFFKKFTPSDSVNIAIVREPLDRMISAAFYYREVWSTPYLKRIPKDRFILNLIRQSGKYEKDNLSKTRNSMGLDFGFPRSIKRSNKAEIKRRMERLQRNFKLVLVMEKFDESLVLLKRTMNWDISDIMYLPTNSHSHKKTHISKKDLAKFKSTNFLDYIIYNTFSSILDDKIKAGGQELKEEVEYFKSVLQMAKKFCDKGPAHRKEILKISESKWNKAFTFPYTECKYIKMEELDFVARLKTRHLRMNNLNKSILN